MTDKSEVSVVAQDATTGKPLYIGEVTRCFSRFRAVAIKLAPGRSLVVGDRIQFGPRSGSGKIRTITASSLEGDRHRIVKAEGPGEVGVFTGFQWIGLGTPVFRLVSSDPLDP